MSTLRMSIPSQAAEEVLEAIPFPIDLQFPDNRRGIEEATPADRFSSEDEADVEITGVEISAASGEADGSRDTSSGIESILADMIAEAADHPDVLDRMDPAVSGPIRAILARVPIGGKGPAGARDALMLASDGEFRALLAVLKFWWEHEWTRIRVKQRPTLSLGNPIVLSNIELRVQVRGRVCVKAPLIGTKCTPRFNSPQFNLVGKNLRIHLVSVPPRVIGTAQFDDIDIRICVRVIKWDICIRIGVTGLVNKALAKERFKVVDFGSLEGGIPYSGKKVKVSDIRPTQGGGGLQIEIDTAIKP